MSRELIDAALARVDLIEHGDVPDPWIANVWRPRLDAYAGPERAVTEARQVSAAMVRVVFDGDRGRAYVSVVLENAEVVGLSIDRDERDGRFWVVVGCPEEQEQELSAFYTMLTDGNIGPGEGRMRPPRWRDPANPVQLHLDVQVADLEAAERAVLEHGATRLETFPGWRVYADPVGHPFCLYPGLTEATDRYGRLVRVVIDCEDPEPVARFWSGMLDMPNRVEESPDRIVVARADGLLPMIAAQRVPDYRPPTWPEPDPSYPAQLHFDIGYDDRPARERLAVELGASRVPPQGGSCPVYADPAGHPFCLCYKGE
ncbi:VOC family protein [Microlunatus sp. GCM10028923]|uniref:VOC family protein n=1 Tax=Microlunatus sp. GCM10028923 TaxID=3273400 RepID=UPI00360E008C